MIEPKPYWNLGVNSIWFVKVFKATDTMQEVLHQEKEDAASAYQIEQGSIANAFIGHYFWKGEIDASTVALRKFGQNLFQNVAATECIYV